MNYKPRRRSPRRPRKPASHPKTLVPTSTSPNWSLCVRSCWHGDAGVSPQTQMMCMCHNSAVKPTMYIHHAFFLISLYLGYNKNISDYQITRTLTFLGFSLLCWDYGVSGWIRRVHRAAKSSFQSVQWCAYRECWISVIALCSWCEDPADVLDCWLGHKVPKTKFWERLETQEIRKQLDTMWYLDIGHLFTLGLDIVYLLTLGRA